MTNIPPSAASLRGAVDLSSLVRPPASAAPAATPGAAPAGNGGSQAVPALVVDASDATFPAILELSQTVPVIVELHAGQTSSTLATLVTGHAGRMVLARVDATANPQLQQAFQVQVAPTVAAVIGGKPLALFEGELPEADARQVLDKVLEFAAQSGVTGSVTVGGAEASTEAEPVEEPLPPLHQEAYDAIEKGDYPGAIAAYRTAIAQDPRDALAVAGLAQVSLLHRLGSQTADAIRTAAAADPTDVDAQLAVADLDVSGGHLEDAFDRLLTLFVSLDQEQKNAVRTRMLEYFEIAGSDDPRVGAARRRLTALLY
ncbi:tetratricopeptide repeat protein [Marisediminicola senii]|uniref:tetratricopeptide repeat protein n=1 Tax=Marisediminicola senii TaxID=2711233 RepID=UPI0013EAFB03|nr:tetratricopeptide repeat protein [Marisediminicola senii]